MKESREKTVYLLHRASTEIVFQLKNFQGGNTRKNLIQTMYWNSGSYSYCDTENRSKTSNKEIYCPEMFLIINWIEKAKIMTKENRKKNIPNFNIWLLRCKRNNRFSCINLRALQNCGI